LSPLTLACLCLYDVISGPDSSRMNTDGGRPYRGAQKDIRHRRGAWTYLNDPVCSMSPADRIPVREVQ